MKKFLLLFVIIFLGNQVLEAQSRAYSFQGGLTVGTQKWESIEQDPLFRYHGIFSIESVPDNNAFGLFARVGYHVKGSAWRNNLFSNVSGQGFTILTQDFEFKNISLTLGAKKKFTDRGSATLYYMFGARGEYTIGTNLDEYEAANQVSPIYPFDQAVQKFTYGLTLGGGAEVPVSEFISAIFEFTVNPDFALQYRQGTFNGTVYFNGTQQLRTFPERNITNLTLELSVGFRFLHKIEYIDLELF